MKLVQVREDDFKFLLYYTYLTMPIVMWALYRAAKATGEFFGEFFVNK